MNEINISSISVILPVYNRANKIKSVLDSIIGQSKNKYIKEIIIIDDGSTDNLFEVVNKFIQNSKSSIKIRFFKQRNLGVSAARNVGLRHARGTWIAFIDSDDIWLKDKIEQQVRVIRDHPEIDLLGGIYNDQQIKILGKHIDRLYQPTLNELLIKFFPAISTIIMKRNIFLSLGGFKEDWKYAEDAEFLVRVNKSFNYFYIPVPFAHNLDVNNSCLINNKGLSGNLIKMETNTVKILDDQYKDKSINLSEFIFLRIFYSLKYLRRILIATNEKLKE